MARLFTTIFLTLFLSSTAFAGIQPASTRVIYPAEKKEVTLNISNNGSSARLLQTWVERDSSDKNNKLNHAPFIVLPPISRLDPGKGKMLRILFTQGEIPQDRESVFWLNILDVPPVPDEKKIGENYIQFPVRTRLKIFYRPKGLPGSPNDAIPQLRWRQVINNQHHSLECFNPSAFNVSFNNVSLKGVQNKMEQAGMCPAKGKAEFIVSNPAKASDGKVIFTVINDYGGYSTHEEYFSQ